MHVHAGKGHGLLGGKVIEEMCFGHHVPQVLIPSPAKDPFTGPGSSDGGGNEAAYFSEVGHAKEVNLLATLGDLQKVDVGISEAREDKSAGSIEMLCVRPGKREDLVIGANGEQATGATGKSRSPGLGRINRIDTAVSYDSIGLHANLLPETIS